MEQDEAPRGAATPHRMQDDEDGAYCLDCGADRDDIEAGIVSPACQGADPIWTHVEAVAGGVESNRRRAPLHLSASAKSPELDYQWFAVTTVGSPRDPPGDGWVPVLNAYMPDEQSSHGEFIQRREMRLYMRLRTLSDEDRKELLEDALRPIGLLDKVLTRHGFPGIEGPIRLPNQLSHPAAVLYGPKYEPWTWGTRAKNGVHRESKTSWGAPQRGRVLVIFQETLHRRLDPIVVSLWQVLAGLRVVYMTRDEREVADRQGTSYGDWAWAKIDLLRDGTLWKPYRISVCWRKRSTKKR